MTKLFASEGAQVIAVVHRHNGIDQWKNVENVLPIQGDITLLEDINRIVETAEEQLGRVDILCNVAGIHDLCYPLEETSDERWDIVLNVDLKAPFRLSRRVIKGMVDRGGGAILNIGTIAASRGLHGPSYCAAKAGLIGMTLSIAAYYAKKGIRCNAINPGAVNTQIGVKTGEPYHAAGLKMVLDIIRSAPVKEECEPEDIASTALFLCSDEARHVNGAVLAVDGGLSAC
jgi:NAD(P)-dependent dehydrogenase (short-subunit alcohol dehydrogenase family)